MKSDRTRYDVHQAALPEEAPPLGRRLVQEWTHHFLKPVTILRGYRREDVGPDLVAGITVAMVALPQAIAYAAIANLPPHYGIYSAIVAAIVGSLWGSSRHLSTGPTNASSILVLSILAPIVALDSGAFLVAASVMAIIVGGFRIAFGLARLGILVNFVSRAVLLGFTAGAGVLIATNQLRHLLGIDLPPTHDPFTTLLSLGRHLPDIHGPALVIGAGAIVFTLVINRYSRKLPGSLLALIIATAVVGWLGVERLGVAVVGDLPGAVPRPTDLRAAWSFLGGGTARQLVTGALAVSLLGLIESISIARTIGRTTGQRLDVNQEFIGQGLASVACGLLSGYACSGSFVRSAINHQTGARTQLASVFTGLSILGCSLLLAPHLALLPRAAVAGVIMLMAYGMVDRRGIQRVLRTSREDSVVMGVTFAATLLLSLEFAVLSGVIFSLAMYLYKASTPSVVAVVPDPTFRHLIETTPDSETCPQLAIMNIRGSLFFGATQHVEETLLHDLATHPERGLMMLRMHGVARCDFTGIESLEAIVRAYRERGGDVYLVQVRPAVWETMCQSGFDRTLGRDHFLEQEEAIDYLFDRIIDPARCWHECKVRVFAECQCLPKHLVGLDLPPHRHVPIDASHTLNVEQVDELIRTRDPLIIDVRQPDEHRLGHMPGVRLVPLQNLMNVALELPEDRPLLLVCRAGRRSRRALRILCDLGFQEVYYLNGGILSWKAADHPLDVD